MFFKYLGALLCELENVKTKYFQGCRTKQGIIFLHIFIVKVLLQVEVWKLCSYCFILYLIFMLLKDFKCVLSVLFLK